MDNPIELLDKIKKLTHDTVRAQYPIASMTEHLARWLNAQQNQDEGLMDYVKRSKYHRDIIKIQVGTKLLHKYVKMTQEYIDRNATKKTEMLDNVFKMISTYVMMRGADRSKYGSLMKGLVSQFSMKNDQYLKKMTDTLDIMSKHSFDDKYYERKKRV